MEQFSHCTFHITMRRCRARRTLPLSVCLYLFLRVSISFYLFLCFFLACFHSFILSFFFPLFSLIKKHLAQSNSHHLFRLKLCRPKEEFSHCAFHITMSRCTEQPRYFFLHCVCLFLFSHISCRTTRCCLITSGTVPTCRAVFTQYLQGCNWPRASCMSYIYSLITILFSADYHPRKEKSANWPSIKQASGSG